MTAAFNPTLDQLDSTDSHDFITIFSPKTSCSTATLIHILQANRHYFIEKIAKRGVLLFRGFTPCTTEEFHQLVTQGLGLEPWNSFNNNNMPAFIASWLRKYSEGLLGSGDYRRYLDKNTVQLARLSHLSKGLM